MYLSGKYRCNCECLKCLDKPLIRMAKFFRIVATETADLLINDKFLFLITIKKKRKLHNGSNNTSNHFESMP